MNHAEHLISTIVSTLNSNKINKIHQVNINTNNIGNYSETISISLLENNVYANKVMLSLRAKISNSLDVGIIFSIFIIEKNGSVNIGINSVYNGISLQDEMSHILIRLANNIISNSNRTLYGGYIYNNGNIVYTCEAPNINDIISGSSNDVEVINNLLNKLIISSAVLAGLISESPSKYNRNELELSFKYDYKLFSDDIADIRKYSHTHR